MPEPELPMKPFEAYPGNEPYVFVSYAHADRDVVYTDLLWLHDKGYRVWYDEGISPSDNWVGVIPRRIATCTVFVVFLSPAAVASKWVRRELNHADRRGVPILPVYLAETESDDELDFQIGSTQALFRHRLTPEEFRSRLDRQLAKSEGLIESRLPEAELRAREAAAAGAAFRAFFRHTTAVPSGYELATRYAPLATVGGDVLDSRILPDGRWLLVVGDIAGHGQAAVIHAAALVGILDAIFSEPGAGAAPAIGRANAIFERRAENRFATLVVAIIDPVRHTIEVVNAGHMPPLLRRASGENWEFPLDRTGLPLGIVGDGAYDSVTHSINPGDSVLLITDGVTDAPDATGHMLGWDAVQRLFQDSDAPAAGVVDRLYQLANDHTGGGRFTDDVTVLCVRRLPG